MKSIFKTYVYSLGFSLAAAFAIAGFKDTSSAISFVIGTVFLTALVFSWQASTSLVIRSDPPSWVPLLIVLRYGLIGLLFYAIIQRRWVRWDWFVYGSIVVIIAMTIATIEDILKK